MSSMMDQHKFIHDFAAKTTIPFNPRIFARSDAEIGNAVKKIIQKRNGKRYSNTFCQ